MKKRTAFIGAILSLIPLAQPFLIKTGFVASTAGIMLSVPEKIHAETANSFINRGFDKAEKGDHAGAISDYTKAIKINPNNALAYYNRGYSKDEINDHYGAISDYTKAIEINPSSSRSYINRAVSKFRIGDKKGACMDARAGKSLGASNGSKAIELLCK